MRSTTGEQNSKWPKKLPELTAEQSRVNDDWQKYWFEINRKNVFTRILDFGHNFVLRKSHPGFVRTLEIGAGLGDHLDYERLSDEQMENYTSVEIRENMANEFKTRWPKAKITLADCQEAIPHPDGYFDRVIAIHILEHLYNLPAALEEIYRLLNKERGQLLVVLPCEGGLGYALGRKLTTERIFTKRYKMPYKWSMEAEHPNKADEVLFELKKLFFIERQSWYPMLVPSVNLNLCIGLTLKPRQICQRELTESQ
jgi:ubiquinone/menaquinone biosynthesis C-methylase UbiE